jgi:hypothetical protein
LSESPDNKRAEEERRAGLGFEEGVNWVRANEDNFRTPCSVCGKPVYFGPSLDNWETEVKPGLYEAFKNWHHGKCASE